MNLKEQDKVRKLMALALDARGNGAECEAAGAKAISIARAAKLDLEGFSQVCGLHCRDAQQRFDPNATFDVGGNPFAYGNPLADALYDVTYDILSGSTPRPKRKRK